MKRPSQYLRARGAGGPWSSARRRAVCAGSLQEAARRAGRRQRSGDPAGGRGHRASDPPQSRPGAASSGGRGKAAGGAAVWCWCEVWPVLAAVWGCCPLLYSYVGRGRGAAVVFIGRARPHRGGASCPVSSAAGCSSAGGGARCGPCRG